MNSRIGIGKNNARLPLGLLAVALALTACGGGSGDSTDSSPSSSAILQIGMQRQYVGTATRTVVYSTPTVTSPNNTLVYSFTESQTVQQPPASVNANFDVNSVYTYTVTQDPGTGTVPISQSVDSYENLSVTGASQLTQTVAQTTTLASNDETSNALGGGPYTQTTTTNSTFPSPRDSFSYPLQTGATMNVPQSSSQNITFTDANASGAAPPNGSNVGYTRTRTENDDGSFSYQSAYVDGRTLDLTQSSDGTGTYTSTSTTGTTTTSLSAPLANAGVTTLPVTRSTLSVATGATMTLNYTAVDWYPNGGEPNSPLVLQQETVVGPATSLPTQCTGAVMRPDIYEIDISTTNEATITGSYSATTTRSFNADGVVVCSLSQEIAYSYDLLTGELTSTTTTSTQSILNQINY